MAEQMGTGVKFESAQAERNIDSFARKVGKLASTAREAKVHAEQLGRNWERANTSVAAAGVNAAKAAQGILSFDRSAKSASASARGLMGSLSEAKIGSAARALGTLATRAGAASGRMLDASKSAGSLATQSNRAASAVGKMRSELTGVASSAKAAHSSLLRVTGGLDVAKLNASTRAFGSLVGSFRAGSQRLTTYSGDALKLTNALARVGTGGTAAAAGINRVSKSLDVALPKMEAARSKAITLGNVLRALGGTTTVRVNTSSTGNARGGTLPALSPNANGAMQAYSRNVAAARTQLSGMADQLVSLRNLAKYYIAGLGISTLAQYADTVNLVRARMRLLTDDFRVQGVMEQRLQSISLRTRTNYDDNAKLFVKLGMAGKAYGVNLNTASIVTENVAKALKISGASAQETASTITQLSQAFASGKLQGDELRSVLENSPRLAQAFSEKLKDMGVNLGNLRQFAKEGKIGITEMVKVLADGELTKELSEEFAKIPLTMGDALTQAKTKLMFFVGDLDKSFGISQKVVVVIQTLSNHFAEMAIGVGVAAIAIVASYVPALNAAIVASVRFIALNLASYGLGVAKSARSAAAAYGALGKAINVAATGTGVSQLAAMPGTLRGIAGAGVATGRVLAAAFAAWPFAIAAGTLALVGLRSEFRPIRGEAATTADYMVTVFQRAASGMVSAMSWAMNEIKRQFNSDLDIISSGLDFAYKAVKVIANKGDMSYAKTGFTEDMAGQFKGTSVQRDANLRAQNRNMDNWMAKNPWAITSSGIKGMGMSTLIPTAPKGGGGDGGKGKGAGAKAGKSEAQREAEELAKALESLKNTIDPVEAARSTFNEGVKTLSKSMAAGKITAAEYKTYLGQLGENTFPALTQDIKDLTRENANLEAQVKGGRKVDDKILKAGDTANEQIEMLDKVIARQGDSTGELTRQKDVIRGQLDLYSGLVQKNDTLQRQVEARAQKEKEIADLIENAMNRTQEAFVSAVDNLLKGSKSLFSSLITLGRQSISQYLGNALFSSIQDDLKKGLKDVFGAKDKKFVGLGSQGPSASNDNNKGEKTSAPTVAADGALKVTIAGVDLKTKGSTGETAGGTLDHGEATVMGKPQMTFTQGLAKGYTETFKKTGSNLADAFKPVGKSLLKGAEKLGLNSGKLGQMAGKAFAGAQIGSAAADVSKMLGFKGSKTGGAVGGAVGNMIGGPIGAAVGGFLGSVVGGLFKKSKFGTAGIEIKNGVASVGAVSGRGKEEQAAAKQFSTSVATNLNSVSEQVGGLLEGGTGYTLGYRPGHKAGAYRIDTTGGNKVKGNGVLAFETEEEAIEAAVKLALKNGVIKGLSETSDRVLKTFSDLGRAIQVASTIENVKNTAKSIRDPLGSSIAAIKKDYDNVTAMFKEAGASVADYADLNLVYSQKFKEALEQASSGLYGFLESLKTGDLSYASPTTKLKAADDKFSSFEKRIASGDFNFSQDEFTKAGTTAQGYAREVYGSTPEFAAFQQRLIDATEKVIANAEKSTNEYAPMIEALTKQTATIAEGNQAIVGAIREQSQSDPVQGYTPNKMFNQAAY